MYRVRKIEFNNHPFLGNLCLDFTGPEGKAVDTIIIAGENGVGKSTILNSMYEFFSGHLMSNMSAEIEMGDEIIILEKTRKDSNSWSSKATDLSGNHIPVPQGFFSAVFSDVEINFTSNGVSSVTSMSLDENSNSRRSSSDLPTKINQLIVDIAAQDANLIAQKVTDNPNRTFNELQIETKMSRFKKAFSTIFNEIEYDGVENVKGKKVVFFKKYDKKVPIQDLSSGEKQIVYRGCFMLQDVCALKDSFVFIDEPEISLHPEWQKKILNYYKAIFTNDSGIQTSQMFVVTHSPFIIHNERRYNDKVLVLSRIKDGRIEVLNKPNYYSCNSMEVVQDAFNLSLDIEDAPTVFLEGRTDEMYFNSAIKVFGINTPYKFKWVGHIDANGKEVFTGSDSLTKASYFMMRLNRTAKSIFLFDCDTSKESKEQNNVFWRTIPKYNNAKDIQVGIENALDLSKIDLSQFYSITEKKGNYGNINIVSEFQKMKLCEYICELVDEGLQRIVFRNIKEIIEDISLI